MYSFITIYIRVFPYHLQQFCYQFGAFHFPSAYRSKPMRKIMLFKEVLVVSALFLATADGAARIVGGAQVTIRDCPYMASLQTIDEGHVCGASIISSKLCVTAGHCVRFDPEQYRIRAGSTYNNAGGVLVNVDDIIVHPMYNRRTADNDMALVFLAKTLTYSTNLKPVALPYFRQPIPANVIASVSGWGTTDPNDPYKLSAVLKRVMLPTYDQATCIARYPPNSITNSMFCAGNPFKAEDACAGDSGGPLVINNVLMGLTSWALGCADVTMPGVYTNVPNLADFIFNHTNTLQTG